MFCLSTGNSPCLFQGPESCFLAVLKPLGLFFCSIFSPSPLLDFLPSWKQTAFTFVLSTLWDHQQREQDFQIFSEFLETVIPQILYMPGQAPRTLCIGRVYRLSLFYREENRLKRVRNPIPQQVALFKLEPRFTHFLIQWLLITAARAGRGPWIARSMQFTLWPSLGRSEIVKSYENSNMFAWMKYSLRNLMSPKKV